MTKTQVTTGKVRLSYVNLFTPKDSMGSGVEKYSVTILIPKSDKSTLDKIKAAIAAAKEVYKEKTGKTAPTKTTIHDGDGVRPSDGEPFGDECKGCMVMTVSSKNRPVLIYSDKTPITDPLELYSGCYARCIINFFCYDNAGNRGISAGINGVMKIEDGEPLGGAVITDADWDDGFEPVESESFDDILG